MRTLLLLISAAGLTACVQHGAGVPDLTGEMPERFDHRVAGEVTTAVDWWRSFGDHSIPGLVGRARVANHTLEAGRAAVQGARASVRSARASLFPEAGASASSAADDSDGFGDVATSSRLSAGYQVDLFGGNRARRAAAAARYDARQLEQRALELSVETETAFLYLSVLALRERLQVAEASLALSERIFQIIEARHRAGAVSRFDLAIQEAAVANARARATSLRTDRVSLESSLAVMLGHTPQGFEAPAGRLMSVRLPSLDPGLPADLLERRPDLLRARAEIRASGADVAVARADFLPSLDLAAAWNQADPSSGTVASLAASLTGPLFSGGALEGRLEQAEAGEAQAIAGYRQAILEALREVEVSLSTLSTASLREDQLVVARAAAERALSVAEVRYRAGADDLSSLLDAQATLFDASDAVVQARLDRLSAVLDLYLALGGHWPL